MFAKFCFFLFLFTVVFVVVGYLFERFVSVWFFLTCLSYKPPALVVGSDNYLQLQSESLRWFQYEQCRNPSAGHHYRQWFVDLFAGSRLKRLKQILEFRGIYLSSEEEEKLQINNRIVDKVAERDTIIRNRLIELINASGHISSDELRKLYELDRHHHGDQTHNVDKSIFCDNCIDAPSEPTPSHSQLVKQFTSSSFIEEEIDYDRTHVWLFYVNNSAASQNSQSEGFDRNVWPQLCQRLSNVGVRLASFDCSIDADYCHRKGWHSSRLLLFTSVGNIRYSYSLDSNHTGQPTTSSYSQLELARLIGWIESNLSKQLSTISTEQELMTGWLSEDHNHHPQSSSNAHLVKLIAIMDRKLEHIPSLTLPLLAVRFANSVNEGGGMGNEPDSVRSFKIGRHFVDTSKLRQYHQKFQTNIDPRLPIYLIRFGTASSTRTVLYCENLSSALSYSQMEIFVGGLLPSTGDLYLVSFILVNLCLALNFFWTRCLTVGRYLRLCLSLVVEFNVVLASALLLGPLAMDNLCLLLSLLLPQTWLMSFVHQSTALLKVVWSSSWMAAIFRSQLSIAYHWPFSLQERFLLTFILTGLLIALIRKYFSRIASFPTNSTTDRSSNFDDQQIENLFRCISIVFCFINFLLFRRARTISRMHNRRRNYYAVGLSQDGPALLGDSQLASRGHLSPNDGSHNDTSQPNVTQADLNGTDEHEPDDDNSDNDDDDNDELIDLDDDLDRMLIESLFRLPNLWLQTELISPDYIRELPLWQYCKPPPLSLSDNPHSEDGFLSSAFSNSSDSSDNDEYSESNNNNNNLRDSKSLCSGSSSIDLSHCLDVGSTSSLNSLNQCCSLSNIDSCHNDNCAQTESNCIKEPAIVEPCSDALPTQLEPNLRVKLEKQKILYVRKRSKNNGSNKSHRNRSRQVDSVVSVAQSKLEEPSNDDGCTDRPKWMINIEECTICLDRYRQGQPICGLPCGHNYHAECIVEWLRRDNHCCPICRWPTYRLRHSIQTKHQNSESTPLTR